ncbi:WecB/TagA/CpsF family glycosyltransferase [Aliiroseovarius sp. YM-037]|uniref:WecB/TagA/CpsF family glycosyltransferase n=1 Tax=Aliiroseovarius sp. YM-037 TaxID=3341728 RepID=UPI003A80596E
MNTGWMGEYVMSETMKDEIPSRQRSSAEGDALSMLNTPSQAALLDSIETHLRDGRGFAVATLNLDHIVKMRRDAAFKTAYAQHSHIVADGNPVVWLSKIAGRPAELVPGSELIEPLAALAARLDAPIAMLGATQETLDTAAAQLEADHPGLRVVARIAPPYGFDPEGAAAGKCLKQIGESGARMCFLALGAPKQERLAARATTDLPNCGFVSIGAGLDFIAGSQTRAPRWVRKIAMEWFWRMVTNPKRLAKRYWDCIVILPGLALKALFQRRSA